MNILFFLCVQKCDACFPCQTYKFHSPLIKIVNKYDRTKRDILILFVFLSFFLYCNFFPQLFFFHFLYCIAFYFGFSESYLDQESGRDRTVSHRSLRLRNGNFQPLPKKKNRKKKRRLYALTKTKLVKRMSFCCLPGSFTTFVMLTNLPFLIQVPILH